MLEEEGRRARKESSSIEESFRFRKL